MKILRTVEFEEWLQEESAQSQVQILERIQKIEKYDHFGECKYLGNKIAELKWKNGRRIYFVRTSGNEVLLLTGGGKSGQNKDIIQAYKIYKRYQKN